MEQSNLIAYLMYTPLDRLPAMPSNIENEAHLDLGQVIGVMLESGNLVINNMDKHGVLHFTHA